MRSSPKSWRRTVLNYAPRASVLQLSTRSSGSLRGPFSVDIVGAADGPLPPLLQPPRSDTPDEYALSRALKFAAAGCFRERRRRTIHGFIVKLGFCRFTVLMTALMDLTVKDGDELREAQKLFDELTERDVVSWTSLIVGYAQRGHYEESLNLFRAMLSAKTVPNSYSYSGALNACSALRAIRYGREIHAHLLKASADGGLNPVVGNNLLNVYTRCRDLGSAHKLFDVMPTRDTIAWNEMIAGYLECGQGDGALDVFSRMVHSGLKPDRFTYATCAVACGRQACLREGAQVHACVVKGGFHSDLVVINALVDMYARCGSVDSAKLVFDSAPARDTVLWTAMIAAYAKGGLAEEATSTFEQMLEKGVKPDDVTFVAVLSACAHGGLVGKGWQYFTSMTGVHGVAAKLEHYSCMVDLLCRRGHLEEALDVMKRLPCEPSIAMWTTFLSSCGLHGNAGMARAARQLVEVDMEHHGSPATLWKACASLSRWSETGEMRRKMEESMVKEPGCSWVESEDGGWYVGSSSSS